MAADDAALATGGRPSDYARFLMTLAVPARPAALMTMASSPLGRRLERVLAPAPNRRAVRPRRAALAFAAALATALPLGCLGPAEVPATSREVPATSWEVPATSRGLWVAIAGEGERVELEEVEASLGRDEAGRAVVELRLGAKTAARMRGFTEGNIGKRMRLMNGDKVLMEPTLRAVIFDRAKIDFSSQEDAEVAARELLASLADRAARR
jgi:hypothetical protein